MTAEPEARAGLELPRGILREITPLSLWAGDTLIYRTIAALAALALPVVAAVHWTLRGVLPWPQIAFATVILAGSLACNEISRRGRREIAATILVGVLWLATTIYAFKSGYGMHSSLVFVYVPCLLYTALFFGVGIASAQLALTTAALVLMAVAEANGRIEGAAGVVATGTGFNYVVGIVATLVATLAGGLSYHRRVEREAARVVADAARHLAALKAAQEARAELETAHARLASAGLAQDARVSERDRELTRLRHTLETLRPVLSGELADFVASALRPPRRENIDVSALASQAAARARALPGCGRVFVRVDAGLKASADRAMLEALLKMLLVRACQVSRAEPEPVVHVGGGSLDGSQVYFVRDNGPALDAAGREKLFHPFVPGAGAPELAALHVRCIVECHGGELEVDTGPGNETTFFFSLPA